MILSYKLDRFEWNIKAGTKIHTIRADEGERWKPGMKIHHARGSRTKNYRCFAEGVCNGIQEILIMPSKKYIYIDGRMISNLELPILAVNDGFEDIRQFWKWWTKPFKGRIIHFTDFRY